MNIEVSDVTIVTVILGLIVLTALWNRRDVKLRLSPRNLELELDQPAKQAPDELPPFDKDQ